jgi:putative peptidoglycan lipid II flippase
VPEPVTDAAIVAPDEAEEDVAAVLAQEAADDGGGEGPRPSVARSTATMSVSTAISRITGFLRIAAQAFALGYGFLAASYVVANNIPNMVYELVAGGILSSLFIPVYMERLAKHGKEDARTFASSTFYVAMLALGLVSLVGTLWPEPFVLTQLPARSGLDPAAAIYMFRFFAIQMAIYGASSIITGILNSNRVFLAPAVGPIFNNLVVIATMLVYVPIAASGDLPLAITVLALGTTLGVVAQMTVQIPSLRKTGFRFKLELDWHHPGLRQIGIMAVPTVLYVITNLVGVTFRNRFAFSAPVPGLQPGSGPAIVSYAWALYQLPYGIFAVALATAFFPELSAAAHDMDWKRFAGNFGQGLRVTALLVMPSAAILIALAPQLVHVFVRGKFTMAGVAPTAEVLMVWGLGLFSFAAYMFVLRSFYSTQDARTPAITNVFATLLQITLYWTLTQGVAGWGGIGLPGIPAADATAYTLHFLVLAFLLRRKVGPLEFGRSVSSVARTALSAIGGGLAAWAVACLTPALWTSSYGYLLQLLLGAVAGILVVWGLATALRVPEMGAVSKLLGRVFGRLAPGKA